MSNYIQSMKKRTNNILKAMIVPAIISLILVILAIINYQSTSDKKVAEMNLVIYIITAIGFFILLTLIFYVGLKNYDKTKKVGSSVRAALYWRAKARLIMYMGIAVKESI